MRSFRFFLIAISLLLNNISLAETICLDIQGMTCATCPLTAKAAVKKLDGVNKVNVSFKEQNAVVTFDLQKVTSTAIKKAIDDVGYKATQVKCKN